MIESSTDNIHILYPDGSSAVFDSSELRTRLARSLADAGENDLSVAEDVALAVEFSLRSSLRESGIRNIPASELDRAVAKSLEDAGFALAAEKFLTTSLSVSTATCKLGKNDLSYFLTVSLNLEENDALVLSAKVQKALSLLGLEKCSPRLALELAAEYREQAAEMAVKARQMKILREKHIEMPAIADLIRSTGEYYAPLFENGALKLLESTALFPSVRMEITLEKLLAFLPGRNEKYETAEEEEAENTPGEGEMLTELALAPVLGYCAEGIDLVYGEMVKRTGGKKLPLVITFADMLSFAEKCLLAGSTAGSAEKCGKVMCSFFRGMLRTVPFQIRYGKE